MPTIEDLFPDLLAQIEQARELYKNLLGDIADLQLTPLDPLKDPREDPGDEKDRETYRLQRDENFQRKLLDLKKQFHRGVVASEGEFQQKVLKLELQFLEARLAMEVDAGAELLDLQHQITDKRVELHREEQQRMNQIRELIESPAEAEKREFDERLAALGLFGVSRQAMTREELLALDRLEEDHRERMAEIALETMREEREIIQRRFDTRMSQLEYQHAMELQAITSLEEGKNVLREYFTDQEISQFNSAADARRALEQEQQRQREQQLRLHLNSMIGELHQVLREGQFMELDLSDLFLSEETVQKVRDKIAELKGELVKIMPGHPESELGFEGHQLRTGYFDIFGFTLDDWQQLFDNLEEGKFGVDELRMSALALSNVFADFSRLATNLERQRMTEFRENNRVQLDALQERLELGPPRLPSSVQHRFPK